MTTPALNRTLTDRQRHRLGIEGFSPTELAPAVALVTGGGRGIGRAISCHLADLGADVAVLARTPEQVRAVADEVASRGVRGVAIPADLTPLAACRDAPGAAHDLVGIVLACPFLRADFAEDPDTPLELIAAHARYVSGRIGVEHVALGSDFDGAVIPAAVGDASGYPRVLDALAAAGFDERELEAIAWRNWRRVLATWWKD